MMQRLLIGLAIFTVLGACNDQMGPSLIEADPLSSQATAPPTGSVETPTTMGSESPVGQVGSDSEIESMATGVPSHGELGTSVPVDLAPADDTEYFVRSRRRMNLDQLQAQIEHATGGRQWIVNNKNQLEELAATLGRPDYISTLFEDLSAGPVFQKFLGDAARSICTEMVSDELELPMEERTLMAAVALDDTVESNPSAVDANLTQLMLRFHGLSVDADAPVLAKYRWLFQSVTHTANDPTQGWRLVCIALMSHPRFYSY
jgi:hypothetical protein